jgi:polyphosphate kinase 2 (PPK2 family)
MSWCCVRRDAAGEVVIWDRSWYNRAGVERVMGFCSEEPDRQKAHRDREPDYSFKFVPERF